MSKRIETGASVVIALSTLAVATAFIARDFRAPQTPQEGPNRTSVYLDGWEGYVDNGLRRGARDAPVKLIEFIDFECPFCRQQAARMDSLLLEFPHDVQVTTHHFPLMSIHRFAQVSAESVECAAFQNRAVELASLIFAKQDSLGLKEWSSFAEEAGVPDVERFEYCRTGPHYFPRISLGMAFGDLAGVTSTPTLVVNGWKMSRPPSSTDELREIVRTVLRGQPAARGDTISVEHPDWQWVNQDALAPADTAIGSR